MQIKYYPLPDYFVSSNYQFNPIQTRRNERTQTTKKQLYYEVQDGHKKGCALHMCNCKAELKIPSTQLGVRTMQCNAQQCAHDFPYTFSAAITYEPKIALEAKLVQEN